MHIISDASIEKISSPFEPNFRDAKPISISPNSNHADNVLNNKINDLPAVRTNNSSTILHLDYSQA